MTCDLASTFAGECISKGGNMPRYVLFFLIACLVLTACNTIRDEPFISENELPDAQGFYSANAGTYTLKYKVINATTLHCVLSSVGTGWLAVGFAPSSGMKDANIIIGYANGSSGVIRDDWGTSQTAHQSDISLGGASNVTYISATENSGVTRLEFQLPLDSGDAYDRSLIIGNTYPIIFAKGSEDDFDSYHTNYATGAIRLRP